MGQGEREQIVEIGVSGAGPTNVVGGPGRRYPGNERLQSVEIRCIERLGLPDGQRYPVRDDPILRAKLLEVRDRLAAANHEIFADHLEPVHRRALVQNPGVVRKAVAHAHAKVGDRVALPKAHASLPYGAMKVAQSEKARPTQCPAWPPHSEPKGSSARLRAGRALA